MTTALLVLILLTVSGILILTMMAQAFARSVQIIGQTIKVALIGGFYVLLIWALWTEPVLRNLAAMVLIFIGLVAMGIWQMNRRQITREHAEFRRATNSV